MILLEIWWRILHIKIRWIYCNFFFYFGSNLLQFQSYIFGNFIWYQAYTRKSKRRTKIWRLFWMLDTMSHLWFWRLLTMTYHASSTACLNILLADHSQDLFLPQPQNFKELEHMPLRALYASYEGIWIAFVFAVNELLVAQSPMKKRKSIEKKRKEYKNIKKILIL